MLFTGQLFSDFGNWLDFTALATLIVYRWDGGPEAMAALMITMAIPWMILGPLLSVFVDRLPRRNLMVGSVLIRAAVITCFIWTPNLYVLLPLVFLKAVMGAVNQPARQSSVRSLVPEELLPQGISLNQMSYHITQIAAPTLGGALIALTGPDGVFAVEAGLLVIAAVILSRLPRLDPEPRPETAGKASYWGDLREGLQHVMGHRQLAVAILLMSSGFFIVFLYDGLLSLWTKKLGLGEASYGYILSAMGAGSVVGALAIGQWTAWRSQPFRMMAFLAILIGMVCGVIGFGGLGYLTAPLALWIGVFFVFGMFGAMATIPFGYILQSQTPQPLMGRVSSVSGALESVALFAAPPVGAVLAGMIDIGGVFVLAGGALTLLAAFVLIFYRVIVGPPLILKSQANTEM